MHRVLPLGLVYWCKFAEKGEAPSLFQPKPPLPPPPPPPPELPPPEKLLPPLLQPLSLLLLLLDDELAELLVASGE
jgi:hypothetical protein